jgi:hypothetical protein
MVCPVAFPKASRLTSQTAAWAEGRYTVQFLALSESIIAQSFRISAVA